MTTSAPPPLVAIDDLHVVYPPSRASRDLAGPPPRQNHTATAVNHPNPMSSDARWNTPAKATSLAKATHHAATAFPRHPEVPTRSVGLEG